ncbi:hypothetical protein ACIZ62_04205 [Acetobacterium carbinolicum]|uniref:hypothetical protein n=1 Tax=Acetobacterium carbinolicum TaxID=52690 RepID=UPI0039BF3EB2
MKKITVSILSVLMMLSMVFSSSVFAANEQPSAWESFIGLFGAQTSDVSDVGVEYRGHVQNKGDFPLDGTWIQGPDQLGTVGEGLRLEAFWIKLAEDAPAGLHIKYQVHVQNKGWMGFVNDGAMAGTEGEGLRIEAIQISLVDDEGNIAQGYSVEYRGHVQNVGDTEWYTDGAQLGTTGSGLRLEALEIKIVQTKADLTAYNAAVAAAAALTEADYTAESWAALQTALTDNVVTEDNTQAEVDAATAAIQAAIDGLVEARNITSFTATTTKTFAVEFNKAVDSATFSLVKGTSTNISISSVTWNDDATIATLTIASKIGEGTYTVSVAGIEEEDLTASVETETEAVAKIEIPSDYAAFDAAGNNLLTSYKVYNQYDEDITTKVSASDLTANASSGAGAVTLTPATGAASIAKGTLTSGDTTKLTIVHADTGVVGSKTLTASDQAGVSEISLGELYNEEGLALSQDNQGEPFYIVVSATDQYGNTMTETDLDGFVSAGSLVVTSTDTTVLAVQTGASTFDTVEIDGVDTTVLALDTTSMTEGTTTIRAISLYNGAMATSTQTVAAAQKVDTIVLEAPALAVVNEDTVIPFEAYDQNGDAVTSTTLLNAMTRNVVLSSDLTGGTKTLYFKKNAATGVTECILHLTGVADTNNDGGKATISILTETYNTTTLSVNIEEAAVPTTIAGTTDLDLNTVPTNSVAISTDNLVFVDQFERVMDNDDIDMDATPTTTGEYSVKIDVDDTAIATIGGGATDELTSSAPVTFAGVAKGSTEVTFTIQTWDATLTIPAVVDVTDSEYATIVRIAQQSEFASYELGTVETIYDVSNSSLASGTTPYQEDVKVYGVMSNGTKVLLPTSEYNVNVTGQTLTDTDNSNSVGLSVAPNGATASTITYADTTVTEASANLIVTINNTGDVLTQTLTISKVAPTVASIVFKSPVVSGGYDLTTPWTFGTTEIEATLDGAESEDSYGEVLDFTSTGVATFADGSTAALYYTLSNIVDADDSSVLTITGNGTDTISVGNIAAGDSFTTTVSSVGGASASFGVTAQ